MADKSATTSPAQDQPSSGANQNEQAAQKAQSPAAVGAGGTEPTFKTNRNLFRLKELLGLVHLGKDETGRQAQHDASHDSMASVTMHRVEGADIKMPAVELSQDPSFELNASFHHQPLANVKKLEEIFRLSQIVHEEISHLLTDSEKLPSTLRLKMPEFLNFVGNFRSILVAKGFVSRRPWEKKETKHATSMLACFLYNVLKDNSEIIARQRDLHDTTIDERQKIRVAESIDKYLQNAADCTRTFLKFAILTNTYDEARSWIDANKGEFADEFSLVAESVTRASEATDAIRWQTDIDFFKWRLFADTFTPSADNERFKLVQMAFAMFKKENARRSPAHNSDSLLSLLDELKAFLHGVAKPASGYVRDDVRNLNLLSEDVNDQDKGKAAEAETTKSSPQEQQQHQLQQLGPAILQTSNLSIYAEVGTQGEIDLSRLNMTRSFEESGLQMQVKVDYQFLQQVIAYVGERKLSHNEFAVASTADILDMLENGPQGRQAQDANQTQEFILKSKIAEVEQEIESEIEVIVYRSRYPTQLAGSKPQSGVNLKDITASNFQALQSSFSFEEEKKGGEKEWNESDYSRFDALLSHDRKISENKERVEFLSLINPSSKGLHVPVSTQLKYITAKYSDYQTDKDLCKMVFDGRRTLVKSMHGFALGYCRHLRAFQFRKQKDSLAQLLHDFVSMLIDDEYESLSKLDKLERAYEMATSRMQFKLENDQLLQNSDYVVEEVEKMTNLQAEFKGRVKERIAEYRAQHEENLSKDRQLKKQFDAFHKSEENQIKDLNRVILASEAFMIKSVFGKGIRLDKSILVKLTKDIEWVFKLMEPEKLRTPVIVSIDYVGRAGMGLPMKGEPVKVQLRIGKDYEGAFLLLRDYIQYKFSQLQAKPLVSSFAELRRANMDMLSESRSGYSSAVNNSQDSAGSESQEQFQERISTPWVKEEVPKSAPESAKKKAYHSEFAFFGLVRNKQEGRNSIVLRQLVLKEDQSKPVDFEIIIEHRQRNHPVKLCELVRNYFQQNIEYRRLTLFWLQVLRMKNVVGAERGFFSEEALVIMMITWLQKNFFVTKAQYPMPAESEPTILKEKVPKGRFINLGFAYTLRGQFGPAELAKVEQNQSKSMEQRNPNRYLEVDYTYIDNPKLLANKAEKLQKMTSDKRQKRKQLSMILMKLCRKLVLGLPRKNLVFDPKKGRIYSKRDDRLLVSIKDPFIKEVNYGAQLAGKEQLNKFIEVLKGLIKAAANKNVDEFMMQRPEMQPISASGTSSVNQTSLSPNTGSPASDNPEQERKGPPSNNSADAAQTSPLLDSQDDIELRQTKKRDY